MKTKNINSIEIEPEIIAEFSEEQAEVIEGGLGSCFMLSCPSPTWLPTQK